LNQILTSFSSGRVPQQWRQVVVTPVPKEAKPDSSPISIQTQSLALRALCKRKPQETQALALASSQSWFPLLRPSIPIGWCLRLLRENNALNASDCV